MKRLIWLSAIVLIAASAVAAQELDVPVVGENIIENGSFEQSPIGPVEAGEVPAGWGNEAYGADGQLEIVAGGAPGQGEKCVQMNMTAENNRSGLHGPLVEIDPTKAYIQFGWGRSSGEGSGLSYGRQWFDANKEPVEQEHSRSYNYAAKLGAGGEWTYGEQLLLPDPTPDDGKFRADEIPAEARYLKVWALCYRSEHVSWYDGLGLYRVDYAAMARTKIFEMIAEAGGDEWVEDIRATLKDAPDDAESTRRARELLNELDTIKQNAIDDGDRHVLDWMADEERTPELLDELESVRWELKIEALLQQAG